MNSDQDPPVGSIRPVRPDDSPDLIDLIGDVYAEYPGCVLDLPGVDDDLQRMSAYIDEQGGEFWVVELDGEIVACVGWAPHRISGHHGAELKRLYVRADQRGVGLGSWLVERVEQAVRARGIDVLELWSDTRFSDAHRLYARRGYEPSGETRDLHDPSDTTEYRFVKQFGG